MRSKLKIAALLLCALSVGAVMYFSSAPLAEAQAVYSPIGKDACDTLGGQWSSSGGGTCQVRNIPDPNGSGCELKGFSFSVCAASVVYWIGPGLASYVAYIGAYFFSIVIEFSLNSTAYALDFLADGWQTVRDLANMAFIFILVFIAITIMLQAETTGTIKQLIMVIVIALLVNFSFLFTRVIIDAGNVLALQFYNAIPVTNVIDSSGAAKPALINGTKDLSASIMGALRLQELYGNRVFDMASKSCGNASGTLCGLIVSTVIYVAIAAMLWMLFFSFLQVGVKFMFRIVALWLLLIASPLAFIAKTMKKTEEYFDKWWKYLIKFSFYPAIFLFMFLIIVKFANNLLTDNNTGNLFTTLYMSGRGSTADGYMTGIASAVASVGIRLGFVLALMYIALHVSEWIVTEGSARAAKITGGVTGRAFGFAGGAARLGVGWPARSLAQSNLVRRWAGQGYGGRAVSSVLRRASTSSFDLRNTRVGKGIQYAGSGYDLKGKKFTPLDLGKAGGEGGYAAAFEARVKRRMAEAEYYKPSEVQLNEAYKKAVSDLSPADRASLQAAVERWEEVSDPDNNYSQQDKKDARKTLKDELNRTGVAKEAKRIAGVDDKKAFADRLDTRMGGNAFKVQRAFFRSAADNEAAAKIRGVKNDDARVLAVLKKVSPGTPTIPTPPTPPRPPTPPATPPTPPVTPPVTPTPPPTTPPVTPTPANTNTPPPPTPTTPAPAAPAPAAPGGPTPAAGPAAARTPGTGPSSTAPLTPPANDNVRAANDNLRAANDNLRAVNDNLRAANDNARAANDNEPSSSGPTPTTPAPAAARPAGATSAQVDSLGTRLGSVERATDALSRRVADGTNPENFRNIMRQELKRSAKQQGESASNMFKSGPSGQEPSAANENTPPREEGEDKKAA